MPFCLYTGSSAFSLRPHNPTCSFRKKAKADRLKGKDPSRTVTGTRPL
ncbi:hypothetical protein HMPREF9141_0513 [Prevotella multiformis DSM 16608]|uniref:Uncharacterized protein n=1 Tax=Prevotella multiformis DSM 16608 TaxID=888743 RepID=F0F4J7_9BACT|nr:hypothetical protein HMPREF9141_0513 [Prevotella multiformis DSM 16608]